MKKVPDIIMRLQMLAEEGSRSDRRLASLVLANLDLACKSSISALARRASVSEPTVTRFCRSLGCDGIKDFKFWLAQAIALGSLYLKPRRMSRSAREQRILAAVKSGAVDAIERASADIDMKKVVAVAERLASARQILCIGSGGTSSMLATEMQNRLFRLGLSVVSQVDGQLQRMYGAVVTRKTMVIAFSISGSAQSIIDAVQLARQYGAGTVAVTAPGSVLAKTAEHLIPFEAIEDDNIYKPSSSRFALLAILDMIATAAAESGHGKVRETLRRVNQSMNVLKANDPRLPLND